MYRKGVEPERIARLCHSSPGALRKYLAARIEADPSLWDRRLVMQSEPSVQSRLVAIVAEHHRMSGLAHGERGTGACAPRPYVSNG